LINYLRAKEAILEEETDVSITTMRVPQFCKSFNMNAPNVYRWIKEYDIGVSSPTGRIYLGPADIDKLLTVAGKSLPRSKFSKGDKAPSKTVLLEAAELEYDTADYVHKVFTGHYDEVVKVIFEKVFKKRLKNTKMPHVVRYWFVYFSLTRDAQLWKFAGSRIGFQLKPNGVYFVFESSKNKAIYVSTISEYDTDKAVEITFEELLKV